MHPLLEGVRRFENDVFPKHRDRFQRLAKGQYPKVLFVTCADSRIDPALITQTSPGELFILRNAGNLVPAHGAGEEGSAAAVEYAIAVVGVEHVIVCGHTQCGAMAALTSGQPLTELPAVARWLSHAEPTRQVVRACHGQLEGDELVRRTVEENLRLQLANLRTHPTVAAGLARGRLSLHAWLYDMPHGRIDVLDEAAGTFGPLTDTAPVQT